MLLSPLRGCLRGCLGAVVVLVLVLVVGLVVVDRVAESVVSKRLAAEIQTSQGLSVRPRVDIGGFPFLTQVLRGRYDDVRVVAGSPITVRGVEIDRVALRLRGVRLPLSDVLRDRVADLPVASTRGTAVVPYATLDAVLRQRLGNLGALASAVTVTSAGSGQALIRGPLGLSVRLAVRVRDHRVSLVPGAGQLAALPSTLQGPLRAALATPVPLPAFPFGIRLAAATFEPDGLHVTARASGSVFPLR